MNERTLEDFEREHDERQDGAVMPIAPVADPAAYEQRVKRIMARLRGGDFFSLAESESTEIILLSDVDDWVEVPVHKDEKGRFVCKLFVGDARCPACDEGKMIRRGLALSLYNVTSEMVQVAFWTMHADSPLNDIEEAYLAHRVAFRGMRFKITRRGTGMKTRYPMTYLSHATRDLPPPATKEQVVEIVGTVLGRVERTSDDE